MKKSIYRSSCHGLGGRTKMRATQIVIPAMIQPGSMYELNPLDSRLRHAGMT
jgi:hypothetical protein